MLYILSHYNVKVKEFFERIAAYDALNSKTAQNPKREIVQFYEVKENESIKKKSMLLDVHKCTC